MITEQLAALKEVAEKAHKSIPGPYFVASDDAHDSPDHKDSGLALVETGRSDDWWVARLCEWPTAKFIAAFDPTTCLELLEEVERLTREIADYEQTDLVPRSRWEATNDDWLEARQQYRDLAQKAKTEIERLEARIGERL
jgi:hypothetical protein